MQTVKRKLCNNLWTQEAQTDDFHRSEYRPKFNDSSLELLKTEFPDSPKNLKVAGL